MARRFLIGSPAIMAEKKGKGTSTKKTGVKKKAAGKASSTRVTAKKAAATPASHSSRNWTPLYLLVILALLAVIVILANLHFFDDTVSSRRESIHKKDVVRAEKKTDADAAIVGPEKSQTLSKEEKKPEALEKKPEVITSQVKIFLIRYNEHTERSALNPVLRTIRGVPTVQQTMEELIKGPTAAESRRGLLSAVPAGLRVRSVTVKNRIAEIDFNSAIEENAAGSILINRLDQIVYTATELGGVDSVVIKINGRRRQFIGSDGLSIGGPMHRRQ